MKTEYSYQDAVNRVQIVKVGASWCQVKNNRRILFSGDLTSCKKFFLRIVYDFVLQEKLDIT